MGRGSHRSYCLRERVLYKGRAEMKRRWEADLTRVTYRGRGRGFTCESDKGTERQMGIY